MYRYLLCICLGWLCCVFSVAAQTPLLQKKVSLSVQGSTLEQALKTLSERYQVDFSYSNEVINGAKKVTVNAQNQPLSEVLNQLLRPTGLRYSTIGNQIVIEPAPKKKERNKVTVSGTIRDKASGEALAGATVLVMGQEELGTGANAYGFYSLTLPEGRYTLRANYLGYATQDVSLQLNQNQTVSIELSPMAAVLQEVEVSADKDEQQVMDSRGGRHLLPMQTIRKMPAIGGESDAVKSLQMLPGVQTANEGTTNLSVRGGSFDQNLILLDEAPVYNPAHSLGFFSVFNPDAIQSVELYKGGIPAMYGGRLSSVVDIRMKEGNRKQNMASGGVGLLASRLTLEGPTFQGNGSLMIAGRYSNPGVLVNGIGELGQLAGLYSFNNFTGGNEISFYDLNLKTNYKLTQKDQLYFSAYTGHDHFFYFDVNGRSSMDWGNTTATFRWNHIYNEKLFSNATVLFSHYNYAYILKDEVRYFRWTSNLQEVDAKIDYDYFVSPALHLQFGGALNFHRFFPGKVAPRNDQSVTKEVLLPEKQALEPALYASAIHQVLPRLRVEYGLRYVPFLTLGPGQSYVYASPESDTPQDTLHYQSGEVMQSYQRLEPRVSVQYNISEKGTFSLSYNRTNQYLHLVTNSSVGLPTDVWLPSDRNIKPQIADQVAAGYMHQFKEKIWQAAVEVFYKDMQHVVDYKDNADLFMNGQIETQMRSGRGWAYGAEFLLRKEQGRTTGWLSYTWSRSERSIEGVNNNRPYFSGFDKRHNLSITLAHQLSARKALSANFVYTSGRATTIPESVYFYGDKPFVQYSERNGYRLPAYHRLDVSYTLQQKRNDQRRWKGEWVFSVYNLYNRENYFNMFFKQEDYSYSSIKAYKTFLFGVLPSVTYNFRFI
ncbi:TonB-dependent receptor [Sabulibacter ruber]|uniref:TonB-dependent receptor n=1 Tax=Sabulibacter ruber TaxID=2811901 RepID=UPI001A9691F3|nr:TonB-dependent receptor [Sabulibacter ruber]